MGIRERVRRGLAVAAGALLMVWPALLNRYPLLYPDSASYIGDGRPVARSLFVHRIADLAAMRSEIYSVVIFALHWDITLWPVVALNALLTSYVVWLAVRSIVPRQVVRSFLILIVLLSLFTSMSWYVSLVMPDIFGALLYLCIYLLVFARETLSRTERWNLAPIVWWSVAAHSTHLLLSMELCALLALLFAFRWQPIARRGRALVEVMALIVLAAGTLLGLHAYLYGRPSLTGNHPPYLMARIVSDGPGRWYLQQHCATLNWAVCDRVHPMPVDEDDFLWTDGGAWAGADGDTQERMLQEEMPFVRATIRAYPGAQFSKSLANFGHQLIDFGVNDFDNNTWMDGALQQEMPASHVLYLRSLQAQSILPTAFFTAVQQVTVVLAMIALVVLLPLAWRQPMLAGLSVVIVSMVIANAFITAVLSSIDSRFQARVVWLVPLLAGLIAMDLLERRKRRREGGAAAARVALP